MTFHDVRGTPSGSGSRAAREAVERATRRLLTFDEPPLADLDTAIAEDPHWAHPHVMKAGFLLGLTEAAFVAAARDHLAAADSLAAAATPAVPPREALHRAAVRALAEGRWHAAVEAWDQVLLHHPRDALALWWAHQWDFYRGDADALRRRPARALPEWDEAEPLHAHVLALHAFGLEECHLHPQAEEAGRRALAADPRVPWAVHAVAHVMEMQGRFDDGAAWLRAQQPHWAEGNGFVTHLWWHGALFRLEALDVPGVLRVIDKHLSGEALEIGLQRVDAVSMLWRLHLLGEDVSALAAREDDAWSAEAPGHYAFNDVHRVLAMLAAGRVAAAEAFTARGAERALAADGATRTNHAMAREVGLPLQRAALAFARGEHDAAVEGLYAVRSRAHRFGGSHAQRDLIDQTLLAAAAAGGSPAHGRAVLNERRMARPPTPLSRHWQERLAAAVGAARA
jgi:hypothetical protein